MLLTFNVNPLQGSLYAINWECSLGPDLVTQQVTFASAVNEETSGLAVLRLIYRTFVALDIYCGPGGP